MAKPKPALKYPIGTKVRFTVDGLGASERDNLGRVTSEVYGIGDTGTVHYAHPNPQCKGWFYVEVESRRERGHKLYVGVAPHMVEAA